MLLKTISGVITTPIFLKIISCVMGFFVWYSISTSRTITRTITVPIYFDNSKSDTQIDAPETILITVSGMRDYIQKTYVHGALHFDVQKLTTGKQIVHATYKNFLLPSAVKVLNCMPIEVEIKKIETPREQ